MWLGNIWNKKKSEEKLFLLRKQSSSLAHCQRGESTLSTSKEARAPARIVIAKSSSWLQQEIQVAWSFWGTHVRVWGWRISLPSCCLIVTQQFSACLRIIGLFLATPCLYNVSEEFRKHTNTYMVSIYLCMYVLSMSYILEENLVVLKIFLCKLLRHLYITHKHKYLMSSLFILCSFLPRQQARCSHSVFFFCGV